MKTKLMKMLEEARLKSLADHSNPDRQYLLEAEEFARSKHDDMMAEAEYERQAEREGRVGDE